MTLDRDDIEAIAEAVVLKMARVVSPEIDTAGVSPLRVMELSVMARRAVAEKRLKFPHWLKWYLRISNAERY